MLYKKYVSIMIIIIKAIYRAQDRLRALSALCRQQLSTVCIEMISLGSENFNKEISWLQQCR